MKKILLSLSLTFVTSASFAYDFQVDGGYTYYDNDSSIIDTQQQADIKGTYYFNSVEAKNGPLNEAAFLGHNSNVYVRYSYNDLKTNEFYYGDYYDSTTADTYSEYEKYKAETHSTGLGIEYFLEKFYLSGEVGFDQYKLKDQYKYISTTGNTSYTYSDKYTNDETTYKAYVGYLPMSNLLVAIGVEGYSGDYDDDAAFGIKAKYVTPVGTNQHINLEAAGLFNDTTNLSLAGDFYFNNNFSVGGSYHYLDDGDNDTDYFTLRTKYFLNQNFALGAEIGFADDYNAYNINATIRF